MYTKEYRVPTYTGEHFCAIRTITKTLVLTFLTRVHTCTYVSIRAQVGKLCSRHDAHKYVSTCIYVRANMCIHVHTRANMYIRVHGYVQTWVCANKVMYVPWLCLCVCAVMSVMPGLTRAWLCTYTCSKPWLCPCAWLCPRSWLCTCMVMPVCKHIYVCVWLCLCANMCVCVVMPVRSKPWLYTCKTCVCLCPRVLTRSWLCPRSWLCLLCLLCYVMLCYCYVMLCYVMLCYVMSVMYTSPRRNHSVHEYKYFVKPLPSAA